MNQRPIWNPLLILHDIELDLDGAPLHSLYVVVPDPTTRNERQITEDAVTTAKLPWCKPLKQCILWLPYLRVILPTSLLTTDNYPHAKFKFTCKCRVWFCFLPVIHWIHGWMSQRPIWDFHHIKLDLDSDPHHFSVVAPDPSHQGCKTLETKLQWNCDSCSSTFISMLLRRIQVTRDDWQYNCDRRGT